MKAQIVDGWPKENRIRILLTESDASQVNSLRRTILSDVPKMAITKVRIEQGTTIDENGKTMESINVLPDEQLAHRLAMVPIPTFLDEFLFPEDDPNNENLAEDQWGSPQSQIIYHCSVKGPEVDSEEEFKIVHASDLNVLGESKLQIRDEHARIPLTLLTSGQYIEFYAYASLGRGRDHAKWAPAAAVGFEPRKLAKLDKARKAKVLYDLDLTLTTGKSVDGKLFTKGVCEDIDDVIALQRAMHQVGDGTGREGDFDNAIIFEEVPGEFILTFEGDGALDPVTIFNYAIKELANRFDKIQEEVDLALA
jgi:DNA-directed RNA polymerase subunit D|tara:strand:- start:140 stop:1066 length:927 start_codon:yes stop_codon:yes gene_type:complete